MVFFSKHRVAFSLTVAVLLLAAALSAMFWARGFKFNFQERKLERTGLLIANSTPTGAEIFLDGRLTSATDTTIAYLEPKTYRIKISKDGFTAWEKDVEIKADLSTEIKALLFPLAPEIKPLTTTGATNPTLSPDGVKIVFAATGDRGGVYLLTMNDRPLPFRQDTKLLAQNRGQTDYTKASFIWSPDSREIVARFEENGNVSANLLLDTEKSNQEPRDVTASLTSTLNAWQDEINSKAQTQSVIAPESVKTATAEAAPANSSPTPSPFAQKASPSPDIQITRKSNSLLNYYPTGMIFSPDEEKILYRNKEGNYKVYDLKLKKEYSLPELADLQNISWYTDSSHIVIAQKDSISLIDADGNNKVAVFTGKFVNGFVFAHPSGTRLVILTTLTQAEGTLPNLYAINLR